MQMQNENYNNVSVKEHETISMGSTFNKTRDSFEKIISRTWESVSLGDLRKNKSISIRPVWIDDNYNHGKTCIGKQKLKHLYSTACMHWKHV